MDHLPPIKLSLWRRYRGLSQRDLAARAGVTQATVHLLETTEQTPRASTLQKLARALDCVPSELYFSPILEQEKERSS